MLGSSIKLSLLSNLDKQSTSQDNSRTKNAYKIERKQPFWLNFDACRPYSTRHILWTVNRNKAKEDIISLSPGHGLSSDTNCVWLNSLVN